MRNKTLSAVAVFLASASLWAHSQELPATAPPEITPAPTASPSAARLKMSASPAPAVSPAGLAESPAAVKPEDMQAILNSLSLPDVQEAIELLKSHYLDPNALNETELGRATLEGLLDRLGPGISLLPAGTSPEEPSPFRAEILDDRVAYIRLGSISKSNVEQMDAALQNASDKSIKSAILDLRATPASSDFNVAAQVIMRFVPKGKLLFTITKPSEKQERILTSDENPRFQGLLAVLVDKRTAGASEVIAAVLRIRANALLVGERTRGEAVEFDDLPLHGGQLLRVAVAKVTLPDNLSIYPHGVKPDLTVEVPEETEEDVLNQETDKGASQFVFETERPRMNEASLVAGTNPELDALLAAQRNKEHPKASLQDIILEHAMDALTSISIYENAGK